MAGQTCSGLLSSSSNRIALDPPLLGPASILSGGLLFVRRKQVNQCSNATLGSLKARRRLLRSRAHSCQSLQVEIIMNSFVKNTPTSSLSAIPFFKVTGHNQTRLKIRCPVMSVLEALRLILGTTTISYVRTTIVRLLVCSRTYVASDR